MWSPTTGTDVDPNVWTPAHLARHQGGCARTREVERIFVNPAIKKALCRDAGSDRAWLRKVRPMVGPRLSLPCPHQLPGRQSGLQAAAGAARRDGCGKELDYWFSDAVLHPKPPKTTPKPKPPMTLAQLPAACKSVLNAQ